MPQKSIDSHQKFIASVWHHVDFALALPVVFSPGNTPSLPLPSPSHLPRTLWINTSSRFDWLRSEQRRWPGQAVPGEPRRLRRPFRGDVPPFRSLYASSASNLASGSGRSGENVQSEGGRSTDSDRHATAKTRHRTQALMIFSVAIFGRTPERIG